MVRLSNLCSAAECVWLRTKECSGCVELNAQLRWVKEVMRTKERAGTINTVIDADYMKQSRCGHST